VCSHADALDPFSLPPLIVYMQFWGLVFISGFYFVSNKSSEMYKVYYCISFLASIYFRQNGKASMRSDFYLCFHFSSEKKINVFRIL
jgi:hypothetical protein